MKFTSILVLAATAWAAATNTTSTSSAVASPSASSAPITALASVLRSSPPVCDASNTPNAANCVTLLSNIEADASSYIQHKPRSWCVGSGKNRCCVSWSRAPTSYTVINSDLVQGVKRCQDACPGKSCKIYQWSLGTGRYDALYAASLCVSNRPKGCK